MQLTPVDTLTRTIDFVLDRSKLHATEEESAKDMIEDVGCVAGCNAVEKQDWTNREINGKKR